MPGWVLRFSVAYGKPYGLNVTTQAAPHGPRIEPSTGNPCRSNLSVEGVSRALDPYAKLGAPHFSATSKRIAYASSH